MKTGRKKMMSWLQRYGFLKRNIGASMGTLAGTHWIKQLPENLELR